MTRARKPARKAKGPRQIPFLHSQQRADGTWAHHWKPSPRLRAMGFVNRHLGDTMDAKPSAAIIATACDLNDQVAAMDAGNADIAAAAAAPRKWRWSDLVDDYRASSAYLRDIADSTRREYDLRLRQLTLWAGDGRLALADIDGLMVEALKEELLAEDETGTPGSAHKCVALLRVLRMMMRRAVSKGLIKADPTAGVRIRVPAGRAHKLDWHIVEAIAANARSRSEPEYPDVGLAFELGFWTMQRQSDLLGLTRIAWRELHGADPRDLAVMAGEGGRVRGFRLQQNKTGRWVDCPLPPWLHAAVDAAFADGRQYLFLNPANAEQPMHPKMLQRRARTLLDAAGFADKQFRDLRRSGMSWVKDMGARESDLFTISGHGVLGKRTIVDTYMPPDTRSAIAAIAAAERTRQRLERQEREETK
jgi:hypothetical protein